MSTIFNLFSMYFSYTIIILYIPPVRGRSEHMPSTKRPTADMMLKRVREI